MSDLRLQSTSLLSAPSFGYQSSLTGSSLTSPLSFPQANGADQCYSSTLDHLPWQDTSLTSHPTAAAPVTALQSETASAMTGGTQGDNSAGSGFDVRLRSEQSARLLQSVGETGAIWAPKGGAFDLGGKAGGALANALAIPAAYQNARNEFEQGNVAGGLRHTFGGSSNAVQVASNVASGVENYVLGRGQKAAGAAFTQAAPKATRPVVSAASEQAAKMAVEGATEKAARRGVTAAATDAAKSSSTLARGAGVPGRAAAKAVLQEGGEVAAKAAVKAVAKTGLKTAAKAAGRFVPGANVAIAALDTATAAATLADPKASTGAKVTSCITAAGSIVAATNIPVVSQIGAAVSAVSSFIGSFF